MYKIIALCTCLMLSIVYIPNIYAQHVWAFGIRAGIDFTTQPPTPIFTSISTSEGSASICNDKGQLLFYTDGTSVWDSNNNLMPNGTDLPGVSINVTASTTQGALIVPMPGSQNKYYVFSLGQYNSTVANSPYLGTLWYSIIDMSLNGGLGMVTTRGILLDSLLTEHMTAVSGNDCNIWLLALSRSDTTFKAYNIEVNGIDPNPVVSPKIAGQGLFKGFLGSIDVSPAGNKLAIAQGNLILYDFDPDLGKITHPLILDENVSLYYYGVCFSPDNTKLYASTGTPLLQFDLSLNDITAIKASKTPLIQYVPYPLIKRAPDGKIYCANTWKSSLNVINKPDLAGAACQFVANSFPLLPGTESIYGLPNAATIVTHRKLYHSKTDTVFCSNNLVLTANDTAGSDYVWNDGSIGKTHRVNSPGTYWVSYQVNTPCMLVESVDTFKVFFDFTIQNVYTTTVDSGMCKSDTVLMIASSLAGSNYIWENGSRGAQRSAHQPGIYWLSYHVDSLCENHVDTFLITYPQKEYEVSFIVDTIVCVNEPIKFQNTSDPHYTIFKWVFGDQDSSILENPQHIYVQPGNYEAVLIGKIGNNCSDTAHKIIVVDAMIFDTFLMDPDSVCTGTPVRFFNQMNSNTINTLQWQFGDGRILFSKDNRIQHVYDSAGILPVMLSAQFRACPDTSFTDTVYVYALPKVDLGPDGSLCLNGAPVILKNLQPPAQTVHHNLWNTGDTTEELKVVHPGTYSLQVSNEPLGCSTIESVSITQGCHIDIPNAFSPNGDGENDYFYPRQMLSQNITGFRMQVLNRWGQPVFETTSRNGQGWDGKFNNKEQQAGVYIYLIEVTFDNGRQEQYQGNVTLIR